MAVSLEPYRDLNYALRKLRVQVMESIPYAIENFPTFSNPKQIFNYLKARTTYFNDPEGRELFQCLPTLMQAHLNKHSISGAGDCDCFSIAALATLLANGFTDIGIVLAGRNPLRARHIYVWVRVDGVKHFLDLTNGSYDYERYYPHKQHIEFKLNPQEKKDMMLELADGTGPSRRGHVPHSYVYLPTKGVNVRADVFDNLSAGEFQHMCLSEGIDPQTIFELSGGRAQRKAQRQSGELKPRQQRKAAKKAAKPRNQRKQIKAESKAQKRTDSGQAKILKGQARVDKANNPRPARSMPGAPSSYDNYPNSSEYDEQPDEELEIVDSEEIEPDADYEQAMEERFLGDGTSYVKPILWGLGFLAVGAAVATAMKYRRLAHLAV